MTAKEREKLYLLTEKLFDRINEISEQAMAISQKEEEQHQWSRMIGHCCGLRESIDLIQEMFIEGVK